MASNAVSGPGARRFQGGAHGHKGEVKSVCPRVAGNEEGIFSAWFGTF